MSHQLPCITVAELRDKLASLPADSKVYAWAPGSHMPVANAFPYKAGVVLLEINVPEDAALAH